MPREEYKPKDKVVMRMTREGAVEENLTEGTSERISKEPLINHRYFITIDKSVRESSLSRAFSGFGFPVIRS